MLKLTVRTYNLLIRKTGYVGYNLYVQLRDWKIFTSQWPVGGGAVGPNHLGFPSILHCFYTTLCIFLCLFVHGIPHVNSEGIEAIGVTKFDTYDDPETPWFGSI